VQGGVDRTDDPHRKVREQEGGRAGERTTIAGVTGAPRRSATTSITPREGRQSHSRHPAPTAANPPLIGGGPPGSERSAATAATTRLTAKQNPPPAEAAIRGGRAEGEPGADTRTRCEEADLERKGGRSEPVGEVRARVGDTDCIPIHQHARLARTSKIARPDPPC